MKGEDSSEISQGELEDDFKDSHKKRDDQSSCSSIKTSIRSYELSPDYINKQIYKQLAERRKKESEKRVRHKFI